MAHARTERKHHADHLELAALVQLLHLDPRDELVRNSVLEVDCHQHPPAADQREILGVQHTVEQIDRLRRSVRARVAVIERSRRGCIQNERHVALLRKPFENIGPFLKPEVEHEPRLGFRRRRFTGALLGNAGRAGRCKQHSRDQQREQHGVPPRHTLLIRGKKMFQSARHDARDVDT